MRLLALVTIFAVGVCFGQYMILPWERYIDRANEDILTDVCAGYDYGSIAVGATYVDANTENTSILVHRYSNNGNEQWNNWQYSIPNSNDCAAFSICKLDIANDYIIAGNYGDIYSADCQAGFILKLDEACIVEDYEKMSWALSARDVIEHNGDILVAGMHEAMLGQSYIPPYYVALFDNNLNIVDLERYGYTEGDAGSQQENLCISEYSSNYVIAGGTGYNSAQMYRYATITLLKTTNRSLSVSDHLELQYDACMDIEVNGSNVYALYAPYRSWPHGHGNTDFIIAKYNIVNDQLILIDEEVISPIHIYNNWLTSIAIADDRINIYGNTDNYGEYKLIHIECDMQLNYIRETLYSYGGIWPISYGKVGSAVVQMPNREDQVAVTLARSLYTTQDRCNTYAYCVRGSVNSIDRTTEDGNREYNLHIANDIRNRTIIITGLASDNTNVVSVYDILGRLVTTINLPSNIDNAASISYDQINLDNGIYIITCKQDNIALSNTIVIAN